MKRIATITGDAITTPSNFLYSMGTPYEQLVEAAGGFKYSHRNWYPAVHMMGFAIFGLDVPTTKTTSSLLCLGKMRWQSLNRSHASAVAGVWKRVRKN